MQRIGKSYKSITLNVLFVSHNRKNIREAFISKYNSEHLNQVIVLMISGSKCRQFTNQISKLLEIGDNKFDLSY